MPFGPQLAGERVLLRPAVITDLEARRLLGRHAEISRMFGAAHPSSGPMSSVAAEAWFERLGAPGTIEWIVEVEGAFLGTARLHSFRGAETARYAVGFFDPARLGKGLGTEVTTLVVEYAFVSLGLKRIDLAVLEFNERAIRCYLRCGFREVRRSPGAAIVDDKQYDDVLMEITPETVVR